jgi:hypothetical protein
MSVTHCLKGHTDYRPDGCVMVGVTGSLGCASPVQKPVRCLPAQQATSLSALIWWQWLYWYAHAVPQHSGFQRTVLDGPWGTTADTTLAANRLPTCIRTAVCGVWCDWQQLQNETLTMALLQPGVVVMVLKSGPAAKLANVSHPHIAAMLVPYPRHGQRCMRCRSLRKGVLTC